MRLLSSRVNGRVGQIPAPYVDAGGQQLQGELIDFFENAPIAFHWIAEDGRILWANRAELELLGYTSEEYIGRPAAEFHADADVIADILRRLARHETVDNCEARLRRKDGSIRYVLISSNVLWENGKFVHTRCVTRDITERKAAEEGQRLDTHLRLLVQGVRDYAIFMMDRDGHVMTWNTGARLLKGYADDEILGTHFSRFYTAEDRLAGKPERLLTLAREQGRVEDEGWRVRKDGTRFWADVVLTALPDESGQVREFAKITRDLTERKQAQETQRSAHQGLEARVAERTQQLSAALKEKDQILADLREKIQELEKFEQVVVGRELKMIALEKELESLRGGKSLSRDSSPI
jgi:PAS domain S-box-containing protein